MQDYFLEGIIKKIEEGAGYEGKVIDQWVIIEIGVKSLQLFDPELLCKKSMIGKKKKFKIFALHSNFPNEKPVKTVNNNYDINERTLSNFVGTLNREVNYISYKIVGKIVDIVDEEFKLNKSYRKMCYVDVGIGKIKFYDEENIFRIGDNIEFIAFRLDVTKIE